MRISYSKTLTLTILTAILLTGASTAQTVISRHNIHIGDKKLERNQAKPEALEAEKKSRSLDRQARLLQSVLEEGDISPREYQESDGKVLYTNAIWQFTISSQDDETGLQRIEYKLNGSEVLSYLAPVRISSPGWNSIEYRGVDRVGNREDWRLLRVFRDVVPPSISWRFRGVHYQVGEKYFVTPETVLEVSAIDRESGLKGIYYREGSSSWKPFPSDGYSMNHSTSSGNSNNPSVHLLIRALDQVNNRSNGINLSLEVVDRVVEPKIHISRFWEKDGTRYCSKNSTVSFTKSESALAETIYYKTSDTKEWREYVTGVVEPDSGTAENSSPRTSSRGEWKVEYKTRNALNQESQVQVWSCRMDANPPQTEILRKESAR